MITGSQVESIATCSSDAIAIVKDSACSYFWFIAYLIAFGTAVPVFIFLVCCGFGCGRLGGNACRCCCKLCSEPNCGGRYPTADYSGFQQISCILILVLIWSAMLILSILGFANTLQASQDLTLLTSNIRTINGFADRIKGTVDPFVAGLELSSSSALERANAGLADVAPDAGALTLAFRAAADAVATLLSAVEDSHDCATCASSFYFVFDAASVAVFSPVQLAWLNGCARALAGRPLLRAPSSSAVLNMW